MLAGSAAAGAEVAVIEAQGDIACCRDLFRVQAGDLFFYGRQRASEDHRRMRPWMLGHPQVAGQRDPVAGEGNIPDLHPAPPAAGQPPWPLIGWLADDGRRDRH